MKYLQDLVNELSAKHFPNLPAPKVTQPMLGHGDYFEIEYVEGVDPEALSEALQAAILGRAR